MGAALRLVRDEYREPIDASCAVSWCDEHGTVGHPYETNLWRDKYPGRVHTAEVSAAPGVAVYLTAVQELDSEHEPIELRIDVSDQRLTPDQARQVASALMAAAERLEALQ